MDTYHRYLYFMIRFKNDLSRIVKIKIFKMTSGSSDNRSDGIVFLYRRLRVNVKNLHLFNSQPLAKSVHKHKITLDSNTRPFKGRSAYTELKPDLNYDISVLTAGTQNAYDLQGRFDTQTTQNDLRLKLCLEF